MFKSMMAALLALTVTAAAQAAPKASSLIVSTHDGRVQGMVKDGTRQFLGIPFAAPPVGDLRWRPPQAPAPWKGVRQATAFSGSCPQGNDIGDFAKPSDVEDCLYLNVIEPANPSSTPRAVMVWFPGGALFAGAADDYDASKLARRGDIIMVTLNYRLGVLGFFSHPAIDAPQGVNYGIMDQQAALRWVRDNIASFGGDPQRVTIAGQSAGGTSAIALMISPASKGLFQRLIDESGGRMVMTTLADATKIGSKFAAAAGCKDQSAACLRGLSVKQIVDKQPGHFASTTVDGVVIPQQPYAAFASGQYIHAPALNGVAGDEQGFFQAINEETQGVLTEAGYKDYLVRTFFGQANADAVLKAYPVDKYPSPTLAEIAASEVYRGCIGRQLNRWWSAHAPVYAYEFNDRTPPSYLKPKSFPLGAYHTVELVYLFPGFHGGLGTPHPLNAAQEKLSDALIDAWTGFVRTGNPNPSGVGPWSLYDAGKDNVLSINLPRSRMRDNYGQRYTCELWDKAANYPAS